MEKAKKRRRKTSDRAEMTVDDKRTIQVAPVV